MIKALLTCVATLVVAALLAPAASAHTAMLRASPDRNTTVGGSIGFIDLEFLDPVTDATVTVTYNGVPVAGRTTVPDGKVITFAFDQALAQPGRYQVFYEMISLDGDFTTDGYFFTLDPAAEQPARIEPSGSGGLSTVLLAVLVAGLALVVGLLALFVRWRIATGRRHHSLESIDDGELGAPYHPRR